MKLLTKLLFQKMHDNGRKRAAVEASGGEIDFEPVVKLFTPDAQCTWLLTELDPDDPDIAFGLCDIGLGCAELGCVRLSEIAILRGQLGLPVERDLHWIAKKTLREYAEEARVAGYIKA